MDNAIAKAHVPESTFGKWFLRSNTWIDQVLEVALKDLCRILKPGGVLLFAESTKRYIHSWVISFCSVIR